MDAHDNSQHQTNIEEGSNQQKTPSSTWINQINEHSVVWLDEQQDDPLHKYNIGLSKLRAIVDYLQCFTQIDICVENIRKMNHEKVFVIVSSFSSLQLLVQIHDLSQVHSIYIYRNLTSEELPSTISDSNTLNVYKKVSAVYEHLDELFNQLSQDVRVFLRQHTSIDSAMPFTALPVSEERTTGLHSRQQESWFPYLLEAFQEIPPIPNGKEKFVAECRKLYQNNQSALNFVKEFDETYVPQMAVSWYTREGILYQLFNRTLRQFDQNQIFLFHFFIYDVSQQLKNEHEKSKDADWRKEPLYRGQRISKVEIEFLKQQKTVYVNTFLSTTKNLDLAKIYAGVGSYACNSESLEQSVIFKIGRLEFDCTEKNVAGIDHLSHFGGAEGEVLFAPSFTFWPLSVEYDENDAVWNVLLCRYIEAYDLRHEFLNCLIKLDVILRTIIVEESSIDNSTDDDDDDLKQNESCAMIVNDVVSLVHKLEFQNDDIVQFNIDAFEGENINVSQFELKALRLFATSSIPPIKRIISSSTISIFYDCLATVSKCIEKYDLAIENYTKAVNYAENENSVVSVMRKVKIAQIHKINGDYPRAWEIFQEISTENIIDDLSYESIFNDIVVNKPPFQNEHIERENYENCCRYLNYVRPRTDLQIYGSVIAENYRNFSTLFIQYNDRTQALECLNREVEIRKRILRHDKSMRLELADTYMLSADLCIEDNPDRARKLYKQAIGHHKHLLNVGGNVQMAICWCEIGLLKPKHDVKIFLRAFDLLLAYTSLLGENIGQCYLCLAKSYARCNRSISLALECCQLSLRFFLNGMPDDLALLEEDFYGCWDLLLSLHQIKNDQDGSHMPTKEELYELWKCRPEQPKLEDEEIFEILETTREQLRQQLRGLRKLCLPNRNRSLFRCIISE